jgi:dienelactone hydrolase
MRLLRLVLVLLLALLAGVARAQVLDTSLGESVQFVPKKSGLFTVELETTVYQPDGDGPFPVAVINHGKASGDPRFQQRYRPARAARYFLQRGYAVVVPMRQGFSKSGGFYIGGGCNVESNGRVQAEDVKAVLDWLRDQRWADMNRVVIVGQSHGGWTTLAFGTIEYPGVKGLVNFAGGLRQEQCPSWKEQLSSAAAGYAKDTRLPSLWFYGDNDSYFDVPTWQAMHREYKAAGGQARLVAFGRFGSDAHSLFGSRTGSPIWEPELTSFLEGIGMPHEPLAALKRYSVDERVMRPEGKGEK